MPNTQIHTEKAFEDAIEYSLLNDCGYTKSNPEDFNKELALDTDTIIDFLQSSQPKEYERLQQVHLTDVENKVIQRICKELELRGTLDVIRNGFTDYGVKFQMAYFKPETTLNPETDKQYRLNQLKVTRQLKYSLKSEKSIDMLLSLNGLPIATVELKNQLTGQDVNNAMSQYKIDRDGRELLFQFRKRALVHFAVDTDNVSLTTKLEGNKTRYLPFNLGFKNGAGNPPNESGYRTSYFWEYVWAKDSWMDILGKYLHLQTEEISIENRKYIKESLIFPRYHQLDVVRNVIKNVKSLGAGKNYLIEHSAGSGKSNSITWLAYHLFSLHNDLNEKVFNSVIVITDRRVLDTQLQNTIYQFEHKQGVVQKIEKDSTQLGKAIKAGSNIIITTLQKFPFISIIDEVKNLPNRNYAIIVDEAHSSQGGEASKKLKEVLSVKSLEEAEKVDSAEDEYEDYEDEVRESMKARGKHKNLSFFAFTATPKARTLEVFGERIPEGKPEPFHLYSMKQAIEEGFILDVLKNYTTYKTYYRVNKEVNDDPLLNKKKANRALARFVSLHPHNISQKAEVMIEHFKEFTSKMIGGKAKAMVVTSSRLHAVRYYFEF